MRFKKIKFIATVLVILLIVGTISSAATVNASSSYNAAKADDTTNNVVKATSVPKSIEDAKTKSLYNVDLVDKNMEWRFYDKDIDPNKGTWYEGWNKRNGWSYPEGWLDWGMIEMEFTESSWPTYQGTKFSTTPATDGQILATTADGYAKSTYFLRYTFTLTQKQAESVYAIKVKAKYNDAMTMYLNGKPVGDFHNIPTTNYTKNMEYGSQEKVEGFIEESFIIEDTSSITNGFIPGKYEIVFNELYKMDVKQLQEAETDEYGNTFVNITLAVELHANNPKDADASFELLEFILNPDESILPASPEVKNISVNVGKNENAVNFTWNALSSKKGYVQIAEGTDPNAFPVEQAKTYKTKSTKLGYTKFASTKYYVNKVDCTDLDLDKSYVYRVGNDDGWSKAYTLNIPDTKNGYDVIFLTDAQIGTGTIPTDVLGWEDTLKKAIGKVPNASFIVNAGDFVDVPTKESEYDAYFSPELLASYRTASAVGNHDTAVNYSYHFNEPNASKLGATVANSDYYFTQGNVLYMVLNTSNTNHQEHVEFMKQTIEATSQQEFDWKVVMFHQSIYASGKQSTSDDVAPRKEVLVPALDELSIDIVLMGHDHCYARTYQMYDFKPVENVKYDKSGAAINPEGTLYLTMSSASGSKYYDLVDKYDYLAVGEQYYVPTFSHLTFSEDTFTMTAYRTDTLEAFDSYTIKKIEEVKEDSNGDSKENPKGDSKEDLKGDSKEDSIIEEKEEPNKETTTKKIKYTVVKGDTLIKIAEKFGITYQELMKANSIKNPNKLSIGTILVIPSSETESVQTSEKVYIVVKGDNLYNIAKKFSVTLDYLISKNNIKNPQLIYPGQKILY